MPALPGQGGWVLPALSLSDLASSPPVIISATLLGASPPLLQSTDFFALLTSESILKWKASKEVKWVDSSAQG